GRQQGPGRSRLRRRGRRLRRGDDRPRLEVERLGRRERADAGVAVGSRHERFWRRLGRRRLVVRRAGGASVAHRLQLPPPAPRRRDPRGPRGARPLLGRVLGGRRDRRQPEDRQADAAPHDASGDRDRARDRGAGNERPDVRLRPRPARGPEGRCPSPPRRRDAAARRGRPRRRQPLGRPAPRADPAL
ncbi:MAG: Signal transduction histidine kinase CheA, partial [uncultured Solirubrobacteraceae bacterium]